MINKEKLIEILSIPTFVGDESNIKDYIVNYLNNKSIPNYVDEYGNVYVTKGNTEHFPCVLAHMDTVHRIVEFNVLEEDNNLFAVNRICEKSGIGGDDKAGIFICLELLESFDNIKAAFFVSEEVGCLGSYLSDPLFFENVGYAIQFDAPGNNWISQFSDGVKLFSTESEFYEKISLVLEELIPGGIIELGYHPYTDVSALKSLYNFSCLNYSAGYHKMHSTSEYVSLSDVEICLNIGARMIEALGEKFYYMQVDKLTLTEIAKDDIKKSLTMWKEKKKGLI